MTKLVFNMVAFMPLTVAAVHLKMPDPVFYWTLFVAATYSIFGYIEGTLK